MCMRIRSMQKREQLTERISAAQVCLGKCDFYRVLEPIPAVLTLKSNLTSELCWRAPELRGQLLCALLSAERAHTGMCFPHLPGAGPSEGTKCPADVCTIGAQCGECLVTQSPQMALPRKPSANPVAFGCLCAARTCRQPRP